MTSGGSPPTPARPARAARPFRVDTHCHSVASAVPSHWLMQALKLPECPTPPRRVYELAKARGMDAVTITDHDTIDGAWQLAHLPDFIVGEEVTATFPEDGCPVHVVVLGITPAQHEAIRQCRHDLYQLVDLLAQERIAHYLAHPLVAVGSDLSAWHVERLLLLFSVWAVADAAHTPRLHAATRWLAEWASEPGRLEALAARHRLPLGRWPDGRPRGIALAGGSDDHSGLTVGLSYTEADRVESPAAFLEALRRGEVRPGGLVGDESGLPRAVYSVAYQVLKARGLLPAPLGRLAVVLDGWLAPHGAARRLARVARWATPPALPLRLAERWLSVAIGRAAGKWQSGGIEGILRDPGLLRAAITAHGVMLPLWMTVAQQHRDERRAELLAAEVGGHLRPDVAPSVAYFTDTLDELNGVSLTAQRMAEWAQHTGRALTVYGADPPPGLPVAAGAGSNGTTGGRRTVERLRSLARFTLPAYPNLVLHVPSMTEVLARAARHDVIHAATPGPVGLAALAAARMLGRPFTAAYHTHLPEYARALTGSADLERWAWRAVKWFYGMQADRILVPSYSVGQHLLAHGVDVESGGARLVVFRRGVDTRQFDPAWRDPTFWDRFGPVRQVTEARQRSPVLVYVGRISREKGLDALLELARALERSAALREAGMAPRIAMVGEGPDRAQLRAAAPSNVLFTGPLAGRDLARAYASSDLFLFPSTTDTFGNAVLEAMASGLPCLVTDVGGPQEMVRDGVTGHVLPAAGWVAGALRAIERLLRDPSRWRAMSAAARAEAERRPVEAGLEALWLAIAGAAAKRPSEASRPPGERLSERRPREVWAAAAVASRAG